MTHDLEEVCGNCSRFFPDSNGPTEHGICIIDPAFASYEDDILELRFDGCRELIKAKRFFLTNKACEQFEPVEIVEIEMDDGSTEPVELTTIFGADQEATTHLAYDQKGDIWLNCVRTPLQTYIDQLGSSRSRHSALHSLYVFSTMGNEQATTALLDFFERLGPPRTLKEVHFKVDMLERIAHCNTPRLMELLLADLKATPSNNTTRQWITAVIKSLRRFPREMVEIPVHDMIGRNVFSRRLRRKIEDLLDDIWK